LSVVEVQIFEKLRSTTTTRHDSSLDSKHHMCC